MTTDMGDPHIKFKMEQESFFLLSFVSWLHNFDDISHWEFRSGNNGVFAVVSFIFLAAQVLVLFDLAYEEDLANYQCQGHSALLTVLISGVLVAFIVCLKMLAEERRSIAQRLVLIRHATENSYYYSIYHLIFGAKRLRAFKLLCMCLFQSFREYGVITFVYVAAVEQLMLFDTIIDYIINSVVVLLIVELDELVFICIRKAELEASNREHGRAGRVSFDDQFTDTESEAGISPNPNPTPYLPVVHSDSVIHSDLTHQEPLLKQEEVLVSATAGGGRYSEDLEDSSRPSLLPTHDHRQGQRPDGQVCRRTDSQILNETVHRDLHQHHGPSGIKEMTALAFNQSEYEAYKVYDYWSLRLNYIVMILPLTNGKITGHNCSENSLYRVSEITMFGLFLIKIVLNVYVDVKLQLGRGKWQHEVRANSLSLLPLVFWSLLEHGVPCVAYLALMYNVFVVQLKS